VEIYNNNNNNIYLLQLGCYPVAVVILHGQLHVPADLPPEKSTYLLNGRVGWSGRLEENGISCHSQELNVGLSCPQSSHDAELFRLHFA